MKVSYIFEIFDNIIINLNDLLMFSSLFHVLGLFASFSKDGKIDYAIESIRLVKIKQQINLSHF